MKLFCGECQRTYKNLDTFFRHPCAVRVREELSQAIEEVVSTAASDVLAPTELDVNASPVPPIIRLLEND